MQHWCAICSMFKALLASVGGRICGAAASPPIRDEWISFVSSAWGFCSALTSACITVLTHSTEVHAIVFKRQILHFECPMLIIRSGGWEFILAELSKIMLIIAKRGEYDPLHGFSWPQSEPVHLVVARWLWVVAGHHGTSAGHFQHIWTLVDVASLSLTWVYNTKAVSHQTCTFVKLRSWKADGVRMNLVSRAQTAAKWEHAWWAPCCQQFHCNLWWCDRAVGAAGGVSMPVILIQ